MATTRPQSPTGNKGRQIRNNRNRIDRSLEFSLQPRFDAAGCVSRFVRDVLEDVDFEVISQAEPRFLNGLELYESRLDKGYSLTDCISMNVCRELGIDEILTSDKHFAQEGFTVLL